VGKDIRSRIAKLNEIHVWIPLGLVWALFLLGLCFIVAKPLGKDDWFSYGAALVFATGFGLWMHRRRPRQPKPPTAHGLFVRIPKPEALEPSPTQPSEVGRPPVMLGQGKPVPTTPPEVVNPPRVVSTGRKVLTVVAWFVVLVAFSAVPNKLGESLVGGYVLLTLVAVPAYLWGRHRKAAAFRRWSALAKEPEARRLT
jgi:protein-S-isoprenylcysteine O-methyltransferase Ste14